MEEPHISKQVLALFTPEEKKKEKRKKQDRNKSKS
jgi:hypothetical protein